jgi:hypothetical protein
MTLDGYMPRGHFGGMHAIVDNRLWCFCGRTSAASLSSRHVDSYDLVKQQWRTEAGASSVMVMQSAAAVALERTGKVFVYFDHFYHEHAV